MWVSWKNESWMLLQNEWHQNKRWWVLPRNQGFSTWHYCHLELVTLSWGCSVHGRMFSIPGLYPPDVNSTALPNQLCQAKMLTDIVKCPLGKSNHTWLRNTGLEEGRALWKHCKAYMVVLFTFLNWFWYNLLSFLNLEIPFVNCHFPQHSIPNQR